MVPGDTVAQVVPEESVVAKAPFLAVLGTVVAERRNLARGLGAVGARATPHFPGAALGGVILLLGVLIAFAFLLSDH